MGIVYRARDLRLERVVAIKLLPRERARTPAARDRFLREARTAAAVGTVDGLTTDLGAARLISEQVDALLEPC